MRPQEIKVTFQPSGRVVYELQGTSLVEAAGRAGIILQTPCGGHGTCGKCRLRVVSGGYSRRDGHHASLTPEMLADGHCLACQTTVEGPGPVVVDVPEESMFEHRQQILVGDSGARGNLRPMVRKQYFTLERPTSHDSRSDVTRLLDALGRDVQIQPDQVRSLPAFLRANDWRGTAVLSGARLIGLEKGDTTKTLLGVAFDVGTTTVVGTLFDLVTGRELGVASQLNGQIAYGDDVIARIFRVRGDGDSLNELQQAILGTIHGIMEALVKQTGAAADRIYEITIAGNSTMQQILCGFDPSALGEVPFVHVFDDAQRLPATRLGLVAHAGAEVLVLPQIGGFIGGDTVAGIVASRLDRWERPVLLVDIGTNGEIVLAHDGRLQATSTAAGPAFEGARIRQGMRATVGAIEKVMMREDVVFNIIGNTRPAGLCGTALIDAAAEMLRLGILDETGRILPADEAPATLAPAIRRRLVTEDGETNFLLVGGEEAAGGEPIYLWQRDIRELQLASGAIRAGISILLRRAGVAPRDLGEVLLAGAFGNFIRRNNARRIGLLPQIPCDRIRFIGNAASLGAKLVLLSVDELAYAETAARKCEHVDLSLDPEFQAEFAMAMMFPDGDLDSCE